MVDNLSARYGDLLTGSYDCVDRIVLNAYYPLGHSPGGFRVWWRRWHDDSDQDLDNARLMRLAGRFARRVRASAAAHGIPVIDCKADERKHRIAEDYLREHTVGAGVFLILVARAPASVWKVVRTSAGVIRNLEKTRQFVNHYSFHIMDPTFGHLTIKMSGHPPFGAQVILNGHEYVACAAQSAGIGFAKEGNCFTRVDDPDRLAQVADTLSSAEAIGRLSQVIDSWIYTACLCFGLDLAEQQRSGFRFAYSIYQVEYSRNLVFASGAMMEHLFDAVVDRIRTRLDVPRLRTLFGVGARPHRKPDADLSPRQAVVIERPRWNLTLFKVHFGLLTLKGYTKGEHVLRLEAIVHNTRALHTGRVLEKFPEIVARLAGMVDRFTTTLDCVDTTFIGDGFLDQPGAHPDRHHPGGRGRSEQAAATGRPVRRTGPGHRPRRVHRRRVHRPGPHHDRAHRVQHPPSRLRPAQTARQGPRGQTRPDPPLPLPRPRRQHHRRAARAPRRRHRTHPRRRPQPPPRTQARHLDPRRPRLRDPPHRHADPLPRPRHHHRGRCGIDNFLSIGFS